MEAWREELYAGELYHYGVKGMKWRHRKKYDVSDNRNEKKMTKLEAMQNPICGFRLVLDRALYKIKREK